MTKPHLSLLSRRMACERTGLPLTPPGEGGILLFTVFLIKMYLIPACLGTLIDSLSDLYTSTVHLMHSSAASPSWPLWRRFPTTSSMWAAPIQS